MSYLNTADFEPKYELVEADDPILRKEIKRFDFSDNSFDPAKIAVDLVEHMLYYNGIGLAANQIGLDHRVFAVRANPVLVCFNPVIVDEKSKEIEMEEGCLTFPNLVFKVKRPEAIKIRYQQPNGETVTQIYTGMTARIMQHEADHLDGILYIDYVSKLKLDMARKKAKKYGDE